MKLYIMTFSVLTSALFGWVGDAMGMDFFVNAVFFSGLGAILGCFIGYKVYKKILG